MSAIDQAKKKFIALYFVIHPFLFLIDVLDTILSFLYPINRNQHKNMLPDKNAVLMKSTDPNESKSAYRSTIISDLISENNPDYSIYDEIFKMGQLHLKKKTFGVREIYSVEEELQPNGKFFKKYDLGEYKWSTYEKVFERINNFSNGILKLGLKSDQNIVLFAETRPEWLITAFSCFRIKAPVVTLYATLGIDALSFGINQTNSNFLITSTDQLPKIQKILKQISNITHLIVITDKHNKNVFEDFKTKLHDENSSLQVLTIGDVEELGKNSEKIENFTKPKRDDLAIIMYTSGSTGNPKGVMISHGNLIVGVRGLRTRLGKLDYEDTYIAYLPLAHILDLLGEIICFNYGTPIGYSSPQTLTDNSTGIKQGQVGDLKALNPSIMAAAPIILERICKAINEKISESSLLKQLVFDVAFQQKLRKFKIGSSTFLLDRLLFNRIKSAVFGNKIKTILSGGAILSKRIQEYAHVCLGTAVNCYGLTETTCNAATQLPNQTENDTVGTVLPSCELRLVDWAESGYRTTDKPNPRGEILIGGNAVTMGYYNMPEKTNEDFFYINGIRYFATGDIGEILPNGNLKIIDRKKDLAKLTQGEYVSLNKIESLIKQLPIVDNVCVVVLPSQSYCVALICPNLKRLISLIKEIIPNVSLEDEKNYGKLIDQLYKLLEENEKIVSKISKEILDHCLSQRVDRFEIPAKIKCVKEVWLPDTGLVTDSLKLKRKEIEKFYSNEIDQLYK